MPELSQERLNYLLKIMHRKSIEYFENENSYEIRLIPELQQAYNQICKLIEKEDVAPPKEDDETRDGRDGWGIGEGHEEPPE